MTTINRNSYLQSSFTGQIGRLSGVDSRKGSME